MQITVDTEKDSPENIRKVIELLKGFVDKAESPAMAPMFGEGMAIFSDDKGLNKEEAKPSEPAVEEKKDIFGNFLNRKSKKKKSEDDDDSIGIKIIPY